MKVKVWHIDWNISDEDYIENLGGLEDDNGLPYTPKALGLPAWDSEIILEIEPEGDDEEDYMNAIDNALVDEYGFTAWVWKYKIVEP